MLRVLRLLAKDSGLMIVDDEGWRESEEEVSFMLFEMRVKG